MDQVKVTGPPPPLAELISPLEQAAFMARQLQAADYQTHLLKIYSSLTQAHRHLSSFLSSTPPPMPAAAENLLSSSDASSADGGGDPMQTGEENSNENGAQGVSAVEERMRECFIKNKRQKRPLSPPPSPATAAKAEAERRRVCEDGESFEPIGDKSRALKLVYQFHG